MPTEEDEKVMINVLTNEEEKNKEVNSVESKTEENENERTNGDNCK